MGFKNDMERIQKIGGDLNDFGIGNGFYNQGFRILKNQDSEVVNENKCLKRFKERQQKK